MRIMHHFLKCLILDCLSRNLAHRSLRPRECSHIFRCFFLHLFVHELGARTEQTEERTDGRATPALRPTRRCPSVCPSLSENFDLPGLHPCTPSPLGASTATFKSSIFRYYTITSPSSSRSRDSAGNNIKDGHRGLIYKTS